MLTVSLCIIAYNEEKVLGGLLDCVVRQSYDHNNIEVVLVNNGSTDETETVMKNFAKDYGTDFRRVVVVNNAGHNQASGWNCAIGNSQEEIIIRVDAHAEIPEDFVANNVRCMESGEDITGGPRTTVLIEESRWKNTLLLAENSMFGSSIAGFRRKSTAKAQASTSVEVESHGAPAGEKTYVKSMFHAAYRREVFNKVGLFNENLGRTEDNEMHYRIREAGYRLCYDNSITSAQHVRSSCPKMMKQKYGNGYWIGLTTGVCPKCLSLYHYVPFVFVLAIIITTVGCLLSPMLQHSLIGTVIKNVTLFMWTAYATVAVLMSLIAVISEPKKRNWTSIFMPFLFFFLHISYGIGTLVGLIKLPYWLKGKDNGRNKKR